MTGRTKLIKTHRYDLHASAEASSAGTASRVPRRLPRGLEWALEPTRAESGEPVTAAGDAGQIAAEPTFGQRRRLETPALPPRPISPARPIHVSYDKTWARYATEPEAGMPRIEPVPAPVFPGPLRLPRQLWLPDAARRRRRRDDGDGHEYRDPPHLRHSLR